MSIVILSSFILFKYLESHCAFNLTLSIMVHHEIAIVTEKAIRKYNESFGVPNWESCLENNS